MPDKKENSSMTTPKTTFKKPAPTRSRSRSANKPIKNSRLIQRLLLPHLGVCALDEMYYRAENGTTLHRAKSELHFERGDAATFDTYFNGISIGKIKRLTVIEDLTLRLHGRGTFLVGIGVHRIGHVTRWIDEYEIDLSTSPFIPLPYADLSDGMLFFSLTALKEGLLTQGGVITTTEPVEPVKFGAVITHFKREAYVIPAVKRICAAFANETDLDTKCELIVVDNSRTLTQKDVEGATLLPNENYGGAGGFTRGLLHLKDHGFTHCLFMDDDATCEIDSLFRARALHQFARATNLAVSGALLRELKPNILFEQGAVCDSGLCRPLNSMRDITTIQNLLRTESASERGNYGAWWFFSFKITQATSLPFPFFVRGDDILFSLMNNFGIETINGIACWGEDFWIKENPTTRYLGLRATLAIMLSHFSPRRFTFLRAVLAWFLSNLLSHNYASANAITQAIRDVAKGPDFWRQNLDMADIRQMLAPLNQEEAMRDLDLSRTPHHVRNNDESPLRRLIRIVTFNGILLPGFLIRNATILEKKGFRASLRRIFRYRKVIYFAKASDTGYIVHYSRKKFFSALGRFTCATTSMLFRLNHLEAAYKEALPELTSEEFWRALYSRNKETAANFPQKTDKKAKSAKERSTLQEAG